jgi:hypothetical protein
MFEAIMSEARVDEPSLPYVLDGLDEAVDIDEDLYDSYDDDEDDEYGWIPPARIFSRQVLPRLVKFNKNRPSCTGLEIIILSRPTSDI